MNKPQEKPTGGLLKPQSAAEAAALQTCCNLALQKAGLFLSGEDIQTLAEQQNEALARQGLIEWGEGPLRYLAQGLCGSPYLDRQDCLPVLCELQEIFYALRAQAGLAVSDDELAGALAAVFDTWAQGSVEYLKGLTVSALLEKASKSPQQELQWPFDEE